jgi:hypothetical protein
LPHGPLVGAEQLRVVDRAVMVHLAPNFIETPKHAGAADREFERAAARRTGTALAADGIKNITGAVKRVVVKLDLDAHRRMKYSLMSMAASSA